ncbi:hypothetical protein [Actinoallomurus sp. NPDC052274]|uniref:hypothetical protein n=1 Tax=Actinoallomurus sp. NPDC052274 TaxID=3155420 RepID=UPI00341FD4BF
MSAHGDVRAVLDEFFAAEAAYISAGGPGVADFGGMAAHLDPDVVMHQAPTLPTAACGVVTTARSASWPR